MAEPPSLLVSDMEEKLRHLVRQRIAAGLITGSELGRRAGFQQAHVSNFLNGRRRLSIEGFDRMLVALGIRASDLLPPAAPATSVGGYQDVPMVAPAVAHYPTIPADAVSDLLMFKRSFLRRIHPHIVGNRSEWTRYIILRASADTATAMHPRISSGATLLVDRHYNSLEPYRRREPNIFIVRAGDHVLVRYVELQDNHLLLRPANHDARIVSVAVEEKSYSDLVIGRVCHVGMEV